jgi:peptidoglycan-N-acetylglucosamine deacetylase
MLWRAATAVWLLLLAAPAAAQECANPNALGTSRVLEVDPKATPRVGRKHFPDTLPLAHKEIVLTFDDGPMPPTTGRVLDTLKAECVRATFFLLGRNTEANPGLARRILADGHTVGHHSYSHPILSHMRLSAAIADINRGIEEDEIAVYGQRRSDPVTPFFRFPGFASSPALLEELARRHIVVFGADVWASDWNEMSPPVELDLIMRRIEQTGRGIVLLHDTRSQTAGMLSAFLHELKRRGYRIVHIVPAGARGLLH